MRVLFVHDRYPPEIGGSEKLFENLRLQLQAEGLQVDVFTCRHPGRRKGLGVIEFPSRSRLLFAFFGNFKLLFLAPKYDLIHSSSFFSGLACFLVNLFGKKSMLTYHEVWLNRWKQLPYLSRLQKSALQLLEWILMRVPFRKVVAVSDFTLNELRRHYPESKLRRIYNGMDLRNDLTSVDGDYYLMYSRLGVSKGFQLLADLKSEELPKDFNLKLVLPKQPGWLYSKIKPAVQKHFIEELDEQTRPELMKLIAGAKAVLFPSVSEGFGFAAYESSVMGKIILHSGRGALDEVVSGRSVRMKEYTAKGLSEAIWAVENSEITTTETKAFPVSRMASEYLGLYREVLSE